MAAVYAFYHPYVGVIGDASLYLGRSLANLDPAGVGRDIVFANDGQSRFSIFSRLSDPLVAALGVERAGLVIAISATASVFAATLALARALGGDRRLTVAIVLFAAVMPTMYGDAVFRFAETSAVPRPFAEAAVMMAIAALLASRPFAAGLFLAIATIIHPIMAMAGVGTVLVLLAWRRTLGASAIMVVALAGAAGLATLLGAVGVPLFARLVTRIDADWFGMLTERSPHLFPSLWPASTFAAPLVHATTITLAVAFMQPAKGRILMAVAISALLQLAAAALFGDVLHGLLAVQVQGWRALWLLAVTATFCLPLVAVDLWREGPSARVALALVGLAWLCPLGLPGSLLVCGIALTMRASPAAFIRDRHALWALAAVATIALVDVAAGAIGLAYMIGPGIWSWPIALVGALHTDLLAAPACLALAVWVLARPRNLSPVILGLGALAASAVAVSTWDARGARPLLGSQDAFAATRAVPGPSSSEVLVIGGLSSSWFALGRPQYFSPEQAVSIVFSRPLAMEWRRRANALVDLGLAPHTVFRPQDPLSSSDHVVVTRAKLDILCRRNDAPAAIVVPDRDDIAAPALPGALRWTPPAPVSIIENDQPPQWHRIKGWVVTSCAALRGASTLAETDGR